MTRYFLLIIIAAISHTAMGQGAIKKQHKLSDKVFFGAGMGMQFGSVTAIELSPMLGYTPVNNLYFGLKGKYEYYKYQNIDVSTTIYGGSAFGMYAFYESVLAYVEYEALSLESAYFDPGHIYGNGNRFWLKSPLIGGGFLQAIGERSKVMILLLWNIDETYGSYYSNPIVRVSFLF